MLISSINVSFVMCDHLNVESKYFFLLILSVTLKSPLSNYEVVFLSMFHYIANNLLLCLG